MSFSLLVYIYIFLLSALAPPLHVPCIRFAIICLTANIQPNFVNGIHLVAKTKTTGKTEKQQKKLKKPKKTRKKLKKLHFSIEYFCLPNMFFFQVFSVFFFGFFSCFNCFSKNHRIYLSAKYVFFSCFHVFRSFQFFGFGTHVLDCEPSTKRC